MGQTLIIISFKNVIADSHPDGVLILFGVPISWDFIQQWDDENKTLYLKKKHVIERRTEGNFVVMTLGNSKKLRIPLSEIKSMIAV